MIHLKVFSAPWCAPCKSMEPALKELASRGLIITKVDIEAEKAVAAMHGIRSVPTLKFYNEDKLIRQHTGALSLGQLEAFVAKN